MTEPIKANGAGPRSLLPLLTGLRFLAAAQVAIFHFFFPDPVNFVGSLFSAGFQAVTFFFVLSGFILAYVYSGEVAQAASPKTKRAFWAARAGRILPAYMLGLAIALPAFAYAALISKITPMEVFLPSIVLAPFMLQAFWPPVAAAWNQPAWSLSVEMVFYALFPLLLAATRKVRPTTLLIVAYVLLLGVQGLRETFHPAAYAPEVQWNFYKFFPLFHLPTFLFGIALGRVFLFGPRLSTRASSAMFMMAATAVLLVLGFRYVLPNWLSRDPILVLFYGLIIFGAARPSHLLAPLASRPMVLLGDASYALYILHVPLLFWWEWITRNKFPMNIPPLVDVTLYMILVTAVSIVTLKLVEQPLRPIIVRALNGRRAV